MARVTLQPEIVRCRATVFGALLNGLTDNVARDGTLQIRISQWELFGVRNKITMSSMGIEWKDLHYLDVQLPVNEVFIIPNMEKQP